MKNLLFTFLALVLVASAALVPSASFASAHNANNVLTAIIPLASITADADVYGMYFPQKVKIVSAKLVNGAAISMDDTNYAVVKLQLGSTDLAAHSTKLTGGTSALVANTPAAMTLTAASVANGGVNVAAGSWVKVNYDETGTYAMTTAFVIINYYNL